MYPEVDDKTAKAHDEIQRRVKALAADRFPGLTFGYIGNCGVDRSGPFDDRSWRVFLPHPGRVGERADSVGGYTTERLDLMLENWDRTIVRGIEWAWPLGFRGEK